MPKNDLPEKWKEAIDKEILGLSWIPLIYRQDFLRHVTATLTPMYEAQQAQAQRDVEVLRELLARGFALIESGYLVRNTRKDSEPGWAMKQIPFVQWLTEVRALQEKP